MIYGYARVSTEDQSLDAQVSLLQEYGCEKIFKEKISTRKKQVKLEKLIDLTTEGDEIVFVKLDRFGRDLIKVAEQMTYLARKDVSVTSLQDPIDFNSALGRFISFVSLAVAQYERDLISERTKRGMKEAKKKGHVWARNKIKFSDEQLYDGRKMYFYEGYTSRDIAAKYNCSQNTIFRRFINPVYKEKVPGFENVSKRKERT